LYFGVRAELEIDNEKVEINRYSKRNVESSAIESRLPIDISKPELELVRTRVCGNTFLVKRVFE